MLRPALSFLVALAVAGSAGCHRGPSCEEVADNMVALSPVGGFPAKITNPLRDELISACRDHMSVEDRKCAAAARDTSALRNCAVKRVFEILDK